MKLQMLLFGPNSNRLKACGVLDAKQCLIDNRQIVVSKGPKSMLNI
jgi:hypothetical protein